MKNTLKVLGIIAIVAVIGFSMAACSGGDGGGGGGGASKPFEVTADASGEIKFTHNGGEDVLIPATVTTDLPAPNNSFTLTTMGTKTISGLTANQKVTGKVSCSGNFIRADVYGNTVGIQTYKN